MISSENRNAIFQHQDVHKQAIAWRDERIAMHNNDETPVQLKSGPRVYIHGFPIGLSDEALPLHTATASLLQEASSIRIRIRRDFHGAYLHNGTETSPPTHFEAWMNTGAFEFARNLNVLASGENSVTSGRTLETWIQEAATKHIPVIESVTGPSAWLVMVSLREVKDLVVEYFDEEHFHWKDDGKPAFTSQKISCIPLDLPRCPTDTVGWIGAFKPVFDRIAQAANRAGSPDWRRKP